MAGYDDPRFLQQAIEQLQRDVARLKNSTMPLQANQKGPIPGWLRAVVIEASRIVGTGFGTPGVGGMSLDLTGSTPGTSPLIDINDGTRDRVQIGNLAAYTDPTGIVSPAQFGERVVDGSGNLIWDALGHAGVMTSLGIVDVGSNTFTSTTRTAIAGTTINFTLTRQVNLLALFLTTGFLSATGNRGLIRCNLDSGTVSGDLNFGPSNTITLMGWRFYPALAAGAHSILLEGSVNATPTTFNTTESAMQLFQLGG